MLDASKLQVGDFLDAIAAMEPERVASDTFQYPKSLSDPDWDGSISINTYTDYSTLYGPFTVHTYREEWDSGTDIYATDAETGKDLMGYIVQCMRASGRYRGELFDTDDDEREDSERLREMDEVEADYAGCLVRVGYGPFLSRVPRRRPRGECSHAGLASSIAEILRGTTATIRTTSSTTGMMTEVGSGRRASPGDSSASFIGGARGVVINVTLSLRPASVIPHHYQARRSTCGRGDTSR